MAGLECRLTPSGVVHGSHVFLKEKESLPLLNDPCTINSKTKNICIYEPNKAQHIREPNAKVSVIFILPNIRFNDSKLSAALETQHQTPEAQSSFIAALKTHMYTHHACTLARMHTCRHIHSGRAVKATPW